MSGEVVSAYGQNQPTGSDQEAALKAASARISDHLSKSADAALTRYLEKDQYHVTIAVELEGASQESLPYEPGSGELVVGGLESSQVRKMVKSVSVDLFLAKEIRGGSRKQLVEILTQALHLDAARGDKVTAKDFVLQIPRKKDEVEKKLDKAETELKSAAKELEDAEAKLKDAERAVSDLEKEKGSLSDQLKATEDAKEDAAGTRFWLEKAVYALLALIVFAVFFLAAKIIAGAMKSIGDGIGQIGSGLQGIAGSLGNIGGGKDEAEAEERAEQLPEVTAEHVPGALGAADIAQLKSQVGSLHEEIVRGLDTESETILLDYITRLLGDPDTVINAVATMELLGTERANYLFRKLGFTDKGKVLEFINSKGFGSEKYQRMIDAGENLKTKLLSGGFEDGDSKINREVMESLLTMTSMEISQLLEDLQDEHLSRLFLYLDSSKSAEVLEFLSRKDQSSFEQAMASIPNIPTIAQREDLDERIQGKIIELRDHQAEDTQLPYLDHYYNIVRSMGTELAESAIAQFSEGSDRVGHYLKGRIVTFGVFFEMPEELREDVLGGLSNQDIAVLVVGLEADQSGQVKSLIPERRTDMVNEEIETLSHYSEAKISAMISVVKDRVVKKITKMKENGEYVGSQSDGTANDSGVAA